MTPTLRRYNKVESDIKPTESVPRRRVPRLAVADYLLHVGGEVRVEHRSLAGLFFMFLSQRNAVGNSRANRNSATDQGHGRGAVFNDDLRTRAHVGITAVKSRAASASEMRILGIFT